MQGLGQGSGAPLAPVTQPVGAGVQQIGQALIGGGTLLGSALSSGAVQQVTQQASSAIVPVTTQLTNATQSGGDATGLGGPFSSLLGTVGGGVAGAGNTITGT
ncbi:collagen-like triple helix repeat-containing protein, partial [Acinetobacter baumannii]